MALVPWRSERPLDADLAAAMIAEQFPELAPRVVRYLDEGFDSEVYEVDGTWIFRFPKRAEVEASLEKECRLLPRIASRLPIAIPDLKFLGRPGPRFPFRFVGYRRLPGRTDDPMTPGPIDVTAITRQIGGLLTCLHGIPETEVRALRATEGMRLDVPAWFERMRTRVDAVRGALDEEVGARLCAFFDDPRNVPAIHGGPPRLVHNDLYHAHVLMDGAGQRVTGIIDWGDAVLGDPALDFAGLHQWLGPAAVDTALAAYDHPLDEGFRARVRVGGIAHAIGCLHYGIETGRADYAAIGRRSLTREFG